MKIEIGQLYRHKKYGFIGKLCCIDKRFRNGTIIELDDGEKQELVLSDKTTITFDPPVIQWKGNVEKLKKSFEKVVEI